MAIDDQLGRLPDLLRRVTEDSEAADFVVIYAARRDNGEAFGYASTEMTTDRLFFLLSRAAHCALEDFTRPTEPGA